MQNMRLFTILVSRARFYPISEKRYIYIYSTKLHVINERACIATMAVFTGECRLGPSEPSQPPNPRIRVLKGCLLFAIASINGAWHVAFWQSRWPHTKRQGPSTRPRTWGSFNPWEGSRMRMWRSGTNLKTYATRARDRDSRNTPDGG